jgi:hypothetical protein
MKARVAIYYEAACQTQGLHGKVRFRFLRKTGNQVRTMIKSAERKQCAPDDRLDFDKNILWQPSDLHGGTGWLVVTKELGVDAVDCNKIVHRLEEDLCTTSVYLVSASGKGNAL